MRKTLHLIPGTMCTEKLWSEVLPLLQDNYQLVYLDIPQNKSFDELAGYYNDILGDKKVNLLGFSLGGYIATYFASLYPERIERLFVISNTPAALPDEELKQRSNTLNYVKKHGYKGMSRKKIASLLAPENQTDDLISLISEMDQALGEHEFLSQYQHTSERADLSQALNQFSFCTYLYYSEYDKLINLNWLKQLDNTSHLLSLICTSGSGHMLPLEKPRELADHINTWAG
ncbi:alpha/beta fold hydrolase [Oceanospirillum sediminis]|uniref:Alpha/beta hydrolase n=1 Tax=Oceanospirillum sediminis TaxID=2760088 RepID=A0A839IPA5_9GAMM|nr:alpha/beta hydrolase [Oceanospirillum sediminis]MBB1487333.1 alpha/beta hydrolase [Oceanospirillum sediminis]